MGESRKRDIQWLLCLLSVLISSLTMTYSSVYSKLLIKDGRYIPKLVDSFGDIITPMVWAEKVEKILQIGSICFFITLLIQNNNRFVILRRYIVISSTVHALFSIFSLSTNLLNISTSKPQISESSFKSYLLLYFKCANKVIFGVPNARSMLILGQSASFCIIISFLKEYAGNPSKLYSACEIGLICFYFVIMLLTGNYYTFDIILGLHVSRTIFSLYNLIIENSEMANYLAENRLLPFDETKISKKKYLNWLPLFVLLEWDTKSDEADVEIQSSIQLKV